MEKSFQTQQDFLNAVAETLPQNDAEAGLREAIVNGICQADNNLAGWSEQDNAGLELRVGRWFIRNDDVPFFQLLEAVASGALTLAASGGAQASSLIGPISNFVSACWQLRRKGAKLTTEQVAVLGLLSTNETVSAESVIKKLDAIGRKIPADKVEGILYSLASVELYDGSVVPLVRVDGKQWRALCV